MARRNEVPPLRDGMIRLEVKVTLGGKSAWRTHDIDPLALAALGINKVAGEDAEHLLRKIVA